MRCEVSAILPNDQRQWATVEASSMFAALFEYHSRAVCGDLRNGGFVYGESGMEFEIKTDDGRVFRTTWHGPTNRACSRIFLMPLAADIKSVYEYALKHLEKTKAEIEAQIASVYNQLGTAPSKPALNTPSASTDATTSAPATRKARKKRVMSKEARAKVAAAQVERWKKFHAEKEKAEKKPVKAAKATKKATAKKATKKKAKAAKKAAKKNNPNIPSEIPF